MTTAAWLTTPFFPSQPIESEGFDRGRFSWILLGIPHSGVESTLTQQLGSASVCDVLT